MTRTLFLIGLAAAAVCHAGTIYSSFGPGYAFDPNSGVVVSSAVDLRPSFAFSTGLDGTSITAVNFVTGIGSVNSLNEISISLSADDAGTPGATLASQTFEGVMGLEGDPVNPAYVIRWALDTPLAVSAGTQYWITLDGPAPGDVTWNSNTTGAFGYSIFSDGEWRTTDGTIGAIEIDASDPAPEPATWALGATSLLFLLARRRR